MPEPVPEPPEGSFTVSPASTSLNLDELADAIERRLKAQPATPVPSSPWTARCCRSTRPQATHGGGDAELLREPGRLEIRPRATGAPARGVPDQPTAQGPTTTPATRYEFTGQRTGEIVACYQVAPGGITNTAVERPRHGHRARPGRQPGRRLGRRPFVTTEGIETFNEMAAACKHREPCDAGLAAIALDQVVFHGPRVGRRGSSPASTSRQRRHRRGDRQLDGRSAHHRAAPRGLEFSS